MGSSHTMVTHGLAVTSTGADSRCPVVPGLVGADATTMAYTIPSPRCQPIPLRHERRGLGWAAHRQVRTDDAGSGTTGRHRCAPNHVRIVRPPASRGTSLWRGR